MLAPFKTQFKAASRKPKGKLPGWMLNLSDSLRAQVMQEAFKVDTAAMPDPAEIGVAVLEFWGR